MWGGKNRQRVAPSDSELNGINPMTLERASEMVSKMRLIDGTAAIDLFCHFDDVFQLNDGMYRNDGGEAITRFAEMCGYSIAVGLKIA
jgi:hypothetical protein